MTRLLLVVLLCLAVPPAVAATGAAGDAAVAEEVGKPDAVTANDRTFYSDKNSAAIDFPSVDAAVIQGIRVTSPRPDGIAIQYDFNTVVLADAAQPEAGIAYFTFMERTLNQPDRREFLEEKGELENEIALAPDDYIDTIRYAVSGDVGLKAVTRPAVKQNTPQTIVAALELESADETPDGKSRVRLTVLHGFVFIRGSSLQFIAIVYPDRYPAGGEELATTWLTKLIEHPANR